MSLVEDCQLAEDWVRAAVASYRYDLVGVLRSQPDREWPLEASGPSEFLGNLTASGQILPLPKESAALANVLEVSIIDHLLGVASESRQFLATRGTERGYPDLELTDSASGANFHAIDIKVARRAIRKAGGVTGSTQSRITLYTGNTYFRYPQLKWPGTFRAFDEYASHLDIIVIYTLNEHAPHRVDDLELIVQPPWKIASHQRSSTTREYIGAIQSIEALREGHGEFDTPEAFYAYWRKYNFRIGRVVQQQLDKLLRAQG